MATSGRDAIKKLAFLGFGTCMFFIYWSISLATGLFFQAETEKEKLELAIARDKIWNLSKPVEGLVHRFVTLRNGLQLHYVTNNPERASEYKEKPLVILIHGYPDSYFVWRYVLQSKLLRNNSTIVAVDLPGYGGSDSLQHYSATNVLEALADFIIGIRDLYNVEDDTDSGHGGLNNGEKSSKVYVVGHDWGCTLTYRLAAEACGLADRFILMNGPHPQLSLANMERITSFANRMFRTWLKAPVKAQHCFPKAIRSIIPLGRQILLSGYIFAFQLPTVMVQYLLTGGNRSFFRGAHKSTLGVSTPDHDLAGFLAGCLGPSSEECNTATVGKPGEKSRSYPASVVQRVFKNTISYEQTGLYRGGAATGHWDKSLETIAALHEIELSKGGLGPRRYSSGASLFDEPYKGALKSKATIIWGQQDHVLTEKICMEGIGDYLAKDSQVIMLPRTGHWTPVEREGRRAVQRVIEWAVQGEKVDVGEAVKEVYDGVTINVKK